METPEYVCVIGAEVITFIVLDRNSDVVSFLLESHLSLIVKEKSYYFYFNDYWPLTKFKQSFMKSTSSDTSRLVFVEDIEILKQ